MAERGGVQIVVDTAELRAYPGALEAAERGVRTGGDPRNREYVAKSLRSTATAAGEALSMDPQTSGGLLAAIDPAAVSSLSDMWWRVGEVADGDPAIVLR
jgi:selenide,water dikinase